MSTLIDAARQVSGLTLNIIGEGPCKEELEAKVRREGITNVLWSPDSSTVYFITGKGALESVPAIGGNPTVIAPDGVGSVAINPAGDQLAYIRKGNIEILAIGPGTTTEVVPTAAPVLVGWATGGVEWATADGVYIVGPGGQGKVAPLPATGTVTGQTCGRTSWKPRCEHHAARMSPAGPS